MQSSGAVHATVAPAAAAAWPLPALTLSAEGLLLQANPALGQLLGCAPAQLLGRSFDSLLTHAARVLFQSYLQPLLRLHGQVAELALSLRGPQGQALDVLMYASRRPAPAEEVDVQLAPIRQRRRIEDEMLRIKFAADQAPGLIFQMRVEPDGRSAMPYASEALRSLYGLAPATVLKDATAWLQSVQPEDRAALLQARDEAARAGREWQALYRVQREGAGLRWHELHALPRALLDGATLWHGHAADVTEHRAMQAAMASQEAQERAHQARNEFLARVSHELRTPLNGILGFAQLLSQDQADNLRAEQRDRLAIVQTAGRHLLHLINEVLDLSRIEAGQLTLEAEPLALAPALQQALQVVQGLAAPRGVQLLPLRCEPGLQVLAHPQRLAQVLVNLLANALKYNRPGGTVQLRAWQADARVRIEVSDTGIGLSPTQLAGLFQPFNRLGAERSGTEGSGLGLVISRHLVELMGGRLDVRSQAGQGSSFSLELPQAADGTAPAAAALPVPAAAPAPPEASGTVLYVEDNAVNTLLMQAMLAGQPGVRLVLAEDGAGALALAAQQRFDLWLLDMDLPDMDGATLLARLEQQLPAGARRPPAVVVSAHARQEDLAAARVQGFDDYWTKPLDLSQTLGRLAHWLAARPPA